MDAKSPIVSLGIDFNGPVSFRPLPEDLRGHLAEFEALSDEDEQVKCVYAYFGLAMYFGQVLEQGIQVILRLIYGLTSRGDLTLRKGQKVPIDLTKKHTLGRLISTVNDRITIGDCADKLLRIALRKRNFLAHEFFVRRIEWMTHPVGLRWMAIELLRSVHLLRLSDVVFRPLAEMLLSEAGFPCDEIDEMTERMRQSARAKLRSKS